MTNEQVIKALRLAQAQIEWDYPMDYAAAIDVAISALATIDQFRWERDMAIEQLKELGYELGEKPREDGTDTKPKPPAASSMPNVSAGKPHDRTTDNCISRRMITAHLKQRLWETAFNNVGIKCNADEVYSDIANNRLDSWMNELCINELPSAQPDGWLEQNKDKILQAGMEGREIDFRIGGRLFAIREKAQ